MIINKLIHRQIESRQFVHKWTTNIYTFYILERKS